MKFTYLFAYDLLLFILKLLFRVHIGGDVVLFRKIFNFIALSNLKINFYEYISEGKSEEILVKTGLKIIKISTSEEFEKQVENISNLHLIKDKIVYFESNFILFCGFV